MAVPEQPAARLGDRLRLASAPEQAPARFRAEHPNLTFPAVVVVIPAYNEAECISEVVSSVPATLAGLDAATLVIDDGSGDETAARAAQAGAYVCRLASNRGQGTALRVGYRLAAEMGARILATLDADGQWAASDLAPLVALVATGRADLASGTRRSRVPGQPDRDSDVDKLRRNGVVFFANLIEILTGVKVTDPANGLRVMTAEVAKAVQLDQAQFQSTELLLSALARGFRYAEAPVTHAPRLAGTSKKGGDVGYALRFSRALLGTYIRERGWRHRLRRV
jgi:glycosyltransferase involved in cell wall biosynthesis